MCCSCIKTMQKKCSSFRFVGVIIIISHPIHPSIYAAFIYVFKACLCRQAGRHACWLVGLFVYLQMESSKFCYYFSLSLSLALSCMLSLRISPRTTLWYVRTCVYVSLNASETDSECVIVEAIELS